MALRLLARRHLDVVYASALRQVRDPAAADDVTPRSRPFRGTQRLVLTATDRRHQTTVRYFDSVHGYTLRRTDSSSGTDDRVSIQELIQAAPGVY